MKYVLVPAAALILALSACAESSEAGETVMTAVAAQKTVTMTPAAERNGNWLILPAESHIRFTATQEGEAFTGAFDRFSGIINFYPDNLDNSAVRIEIPLASVSAGSKDRDNTLPDKVWFSTKSFPKAQFEAGTFERTGDTTYVAKGELTLKGRTEPLDLPFNLQIDNGRAVMTSQVTLDRTRWNVGEDPWNTGEWVSTDVELDLRVVATDPR